MNLTGSLNFQFSGVTVVSPDGSITPSRAKTSRPTEHKVLGAVSKHFASGSQGEIVSGATALPPLQSWTHGSWRPLSHIGGHIKVIITVSYYKL